MSMSTSVRQGRWRNTATDSREYTSSAARYRTWMAGFEEAEDWFVSERGSLPCDSWRQWFERPQNEMRDSRFEIRLVRRRQQLVIVVVVVP